MIRKSRIYDEDFEKLENKKVTIIGCGGTGSWLAELLAKTGINLVLMDPDIVEESNLERQNFDKSDIGKLKVNALKERLMNFSTIETYSLKINEKNIENFEFYDLLIDCTDSFESKKIIANYALRNQIPYVFTSVQGNYGMIYIYKPYKKSIIEIFKDKVFKRLDEFGVTNSAVMALSALTASIVYDYLLSKEIPEEIIYFNLENYEIQKIKVK
ncbi:MAG: ThiF family adenylyltransferase [Candidatus Woesearchaeota archaeon]